MKATILIVDDVETSSVALELACASIDGMDVLLAPTAVHALRILHDRSRDVRAVITDLQMPGGMDGLELIRTIRSESRYRGIPVIVVSADADPETPARTRSLGADAFFLKPCSPLAVRQKLELLLDGLRSSS